MSFIYLNKESLQKTHPLQRGQLSELIWFIGYWFNKYFSGPCQIPGRVLNTYN